MFGRTFRSKYRTCYETCRYRDRIDLLASQLSILKYAEQRIRWHVREWLRFTKYCADASIDLPSSICAREVEDYLRQRSPRAGQHRRFVRTALRIFIEADDQGNFPRRIACTAQAHNGDIHRMGHPVFTFSPRTPGASRSDAATERSFRYVNLRSLLRGAAFVISAVSTSTISMISAVIPGAINPPPGPCI